MIGLIDEQTHWRRRQRAISRMQLLRLRPGKMLAPLLLLSLELAAEQTPCETWNAPGFFQTASIDTLEHCVTLGADLNSRDADGWTPIHYAARFANTPAIIAALAEAGAYLDATGKDGWMPIHFAARYNSSAEVVAALVAAGSDPNAAADYGQRPLHHAVTREDDSSAVVAALIARP